MIESQPDDGGVAIAKETATKLGLRLETMYNKWPGLYAQQFDSVVGLTLELKRKFMGGEIRHATNGIRLLRIWRSGRGRSEERAMDEHIVIDGVSDLDELRASGKVIDFDGAF